jgi:hypothetical protein
VQVTVIEVAPWATSALLGVLISAEVEQQPLAHSFVPAGHTHRLAKHTCGGAQQPWPQIELPSGHERQVPSTQRSLPEQHAVPQRCSPASHAGRQTPPTHSSPTAQQVPAQSAR